MRWASFISHCLMPEWLLPLLMLEYSCHIMFFSYSTMIYVSLLSFRFWPLVVISSETQEYVAARIFVQFHNLCNCLLFQLLKTTWTGRFTFCCKVLLVLQFSRMLAFGKFNISKIECCSCYIEWARIIFFYSSDSQCFYLLRFSCICLRDILFSFIEFLLQNFASHIM